MRSSIFLGAIGGHFVRTEAGKQSVPVIVRDKRKAFAQGSKATEAIHPSVRWIASLRSQ
jgi:hypothetical protein